MPAGRINPTLFDKLVAGVEIAGLKRRADAPDAGKSGHNADLMQYLTADIDRFGEAALRANVRRELTWLLNTTHLESLVDLAPYPQVRTSVLNYGIADLTGKSHSRAAMLARAAKIREAITTFEPRLDPKSLAVEVRSGAERQNTLTYLIAGDITAAVHALNVQYITEIEVDTGAATVRE